MVKLIRLTTTDENAIFDNDFVPNIIIPPKSSIALKSLALENVISNIVINSRNDKIKFQIKDPPAVGPALGTYETQLTHATYDSITAPSLFRDMNIKMNQQYDPTYTSTAVGIETECAVNNSNKFEVRTFRGQLNDHINQVVLDKGAVAVSRAPSQSPYYYTSASAPTGNNCFMYDPRPIARGGGVLRFKIRRVSTTADNIIFGLTSVNPDTITGTSFDLAKLDYGVKIPAIAAVPALEYQSGTAGTFTNTGVIPSAVINDSTNNDTLQICINQGKIQSEVWTNAGGFTLLEDFGDYTYPTDLYPVVIFLDNASQISNYRFTPSPFHNLDNVATFDATTPVIETQLHLGEPPQPPRNPTKYNLIFEEESLPTFLGYNNVSIPFPVGTTILTSAFRAVAENIFRPNNKSDALIVEFLNLTLMSYDGLVKDRKSYLNVIPEDDSNGQIIYDTPFPIYIDIDNANSLSIRNLRCRVLNNDLSNLVMRGLGTIVLLLKTPNE